MTAFLLVTAWAALALLLGHLAFGARWIPDATRDIWGTYVRLWRKARGRR